MAPRARCLLPLVAMFLALSTRAVSAEGGGEVQVGQWTISTAPGYEMPAMEARLRGHADVDIPVCPPDTTACSNAKGDQTTCCPGRCGADNDPVATCYVVKSRKVEPGKQSPVASTNSPVATTALAASQIGHAGTVCSAGTPTPCTSGNGKNTICCPGACGPAKGNSASCAPVTTPPVTAPAPTAQNGPPVTPDPNFGTKLPTPPAGYVWVANPALTDEFDGTSLDTTKWQPKHPYWAGREPSQFDPANVAVGGGSAKLTSTTKVNDMKEVANSQSDPWVSSACIASLGATAGFGFYEARMKASSLNMTSSFWLQSPSFEIDVIESIGNPENTWGSTYMNMNTHWFQSGQDRYISNNYQLTPVPTYTSGDFHTYSVWFKDAQNLLFYFDGQLVWQMTPPARFTEQMWLFLDTETFTWEGLPTVESLKDPSKNIFSVDYVRAFTLKPAR